MSIQETDIVDFISIDLNGYVVLTISDDLEWDDEHHHLVLLQKKINAYLSFIESGEIYREFPNALNREISIEVVAKYESNVQGSLFIVRVKEALSTAGYYFDFRVLKEKR